MSALRACLNHPISQSPYANKDNNLRRSFGVETQQRHIPLKLHCQSLLLRASLNVGVEEAPNAAVAVGGGKKTEELIEDEKKFLVGTYARAPVVLERGKGCKVYDVEGREYLDLSAGIAVNALGHCDADWLRAVVEQAGTLTHVSNIFYSVPQVWAYP